MDIQRMEGYGSVNACKSLSSNHVHHTRCELTCLFMCCTSLYLAWSRSFAWYPLFSISTWGSPSFIYLGTTSEQHAIVWSLRWTLVTQFMISAKSCDQAFHRVRDSYSKKIGFSVYCICIAIGIKHCWHWALFILQAYPSTPPRFYHQSTIHNGLFTIQSAHLWGMVRKRSIQRKCTQYHKCQGEHVNSNRQQRRPALNLSVWSCEAAAICNQFVVFRWQ